MAKINPLFGKGTGKVGAFLLQVNSGVQILKEKPVNVANPNTDAQVEQRQKLKLMSQLAADLASSIAFRKEGLISARNKFVSANIGKATMEEGAATIKVLDLDLTGSNSPLGNVTTVDGSGGVRTIKLDAAAPADVARVVYGVYKRGIDGQLSLVKNIVVEEAGDNGDFPTELQFTSGRHIIYAYGIKDKTSKTTVKFEEYEASDDLSFAMLDILKSLSVSDYALTATTATTVNA